MKTSATILALAAALMSLAPLAASAKGQPTPHEIQVAKCNQKAHEQARLLKQHFAQRDINQDGRLDAGEWRDPRMSAGCDAKCHDRIDRNHDGVVEASEVGRHV